MKRIIAIVSAMTFIAAIFMTSGLNAQVWTKEQQSVWQVVTETWENWKSGDIEKTLGVFHDQYQGWNHETPLPTNKAKLTNHWMMMKDMMTIMYYDVEPARITVTDEAAVVNYYWEFYMVMEMGDKKNEEELKGRATEFYVKEKGKWKLLGDMTYFYGDDDDEDDDDD